jgi:hypothetical protein
MKTLQENIDLMVERIRNFKTDMERVRNKWKSENQITSQIKKHSGSIGCD